MAENEENKQNSENKKSGGSFNNPFSKPPGKTPKNNNIFWIYGLIAVAIFAIQFLDFGKGSKQISQTDFYSKLSSKEVTKIVIVNKEIAEIYINRTTSTDDGVMSGGAGPDFTMTIGSVDSFEDNIKEAQASLPNNEKIKPEYETRHDYMGEIVSWILPILILVGVWMFIFRRMSGGAGGAGSQIFNIGKSRAKVFDNAESEVKTNFKDVAGLEEAKIEIREIVDFLKNPKKYTELGGKIPKGALLVGPPGTGKTLLAKAVAGEAHVPFFSMSGSDFVEMFVGVGASRVRDLFKQAKEKAPCIIFIDEIDAIGRARGKNPNMGSNDERENTLNQLLTEMDGFDTNTGVIILAATNRADILDKALMRAGRFDRQIHVELPDLNEREDIFKVHLKPLKLSELVDVPFLAKQTPGFSGADIANVCNEAALIAARKNKTQVEKQDFLDAIDRIIGGLEKRNKIITVQEKKTIAYHEAGHATLSWLLEYAHPLVKVTIIPRGKALGAAWYLPEERQITTTEQILDEMCATLGGRIAEEIVFGKISTGALNDLERVTKQAYAMVSYFGMSSKIGNLSFYDSSGQNEFFVGKPYSEETAQTIDKEAKAIIDSAYSKGKEILQKNADGLKQLAEKLLEKEVIFSEDLELIFGKSRNTKSLDELSVRPENAEI
ncbi:MAG: ATP-dependent zinc metalloprotease FtsH [Bacteroidales bacterium]|nr:ATP-dependent zinc metalloprotease FtsH [Bacteroidales bacterium]